MRAHERDDTSLQAEDGESRLQAEDGRSRRVARLARFPLELLLIAVMYAIAYGRDLAGCSSTSTAPPGSTSSAPSTSGASASRSPDP
jgi:hypothetical protein